MSTATHPGATMLPSTNDTMAIVVLLATYMIRIAATGPGVNPPWFLYLATDFLLPVMAGGWLFMSAGYALYRRLR